jgi:hypothetical protein
MCVDIWESRDCEAVCEVEADEGAEVEEAEDAGGACGV